MNLSGSGQVSPCDRRREGEGAAGQEEEQQQVSKAPSGPAVRLALSSVRLGGHHSRGPRDSTFKYPCDSAFATRSRRLSEMWRLSMVIGMIAVARAGPYDRMTTSTNDRMTASTNDRMTAAMSDRTLFIRSLPGYPGTRSDLYEVYMEPYYFAVGLKAVVELKALNEGGEPVNGPRGILTLEQHPEGVRVTGVIEGLTPGLHGFHVHEKGDLRKGCNSAGPHFNPYMVTHGAPSDPLRHVGDLGNIEVGQNGVARIDGMDHYLSLVGVRGAIGRALVIHAKPDDLGRGGTEDSIKTGSAGARVACGVIGFL